MRIYDIERVYINDKYLSRFRIDPSGMFLSLDAMAESYEKRTEEHEKENESTDREDTK
ncbi:MAG: hypothetical protein WD876_00175 [Candidatus Pacearchaeota archaeon]